MLRSSTRLLLLALVPALGALAVATGMSWWLLPQLITNAAGEALLSAAEVMVADGVAARSSTDELEAWVDRAARGRQLRVTVIAADGTVLAESDVAPGRREQIENHRLRPEVTAAMSSGRGIAVRRSTTTGDQYVYAALRYTDTGGSLRVLRLAEPLHQLSLLRRRLLSTLGTAAVVAALALLVLSGWLSRRLFAPLTDLGVGATRLASGDFAYRLAIPREEALASLAIALNRLGSTVQDQIAAVGAERDHLREILSSMAEGVLVTDSRGRALLVNPAFARLFGLRGETAQKSMLELTRLPALADLVHHALAERRPSSHQIDLPSPTRRNLALAAAPLAGGGGAVVVATDVTANTRIAEMRRDFVANVSHELKTPLAAIRGYAETLADGALDDSSNARRFVGRILDQCQRLQALLEDLLTLSRLETIDRVREGEPVDPNELVRQAVEAVGPSAASRQVTVTWRGTKQHAGDAASDPAVPWLHGDAEGLERMLVNLVDNAVKYNRKGGEVHVAVEHRGSDLVFVVRDTGIGIPASALPRIFERFYRVDKGRSREEGGTGLGLAIVKHAAQAHGGRVEVVSEPGAGSTFRVILPLGETWSGQIVE